ncbi:MAG: PhnD/SsuA/transferrin family substrate-binding protein, partial [Clostridiales bacterium]|nr:PhnD/SsuA/transferrin family substrate-binding protein [Clostridiales bacterium]
MIKQRIALLLAALMLLGTFGLAGCKKDEIPHLSFVDGNGNYVLDADRDLVADAPTDPALWRDPDVLTFSYAPLGSGGVYATLFDHFVEFLKEKTGKEVVQQVVEHESSAIVDMRDHKLDIGSFAAGTTCYAVNLAGYVPYAVKGTAAGPQSYRLGVVVTEENFQSGKFTTLADMKDAYVAHATATSSSGHIAPLALLPQEGITPGVDY